MRVWVADDDYPEAYKALNPVDDTVSRNAEYRVFPVTHDGHWLGRSETTGPWRPGLWVKLGAEAAAAPIDRAVGLVAPVTDIEMRVSVMTNDAGVPIVLVNGIPELSVAIRQSPMPGADASSVACVGSPVYQKLTHPEVLQRLSLLIDVKQKDVRSLRASGGLRTLSLSRCPCLKSLRGLTDLPRLQTLVVDSCDALKDVNEISKASTLKELGLQLSTKVDTIPDLSRLENLEILDLSGSRNLDSLGPIREAQNLRVVCLRHCAGPLDVRPLADLPMLEYLDLTGTPVLDASAISGVENLVGVTLPESSPERVVHFPSPAGSRTHGAPELTGLEMLEGLGEMQEAEDLDLSSSSSLRTLEGVEKLPKLKRLDLSGCRSLIDLSALEGHASLESINLWGCAVLRRIEPLLKCPALREIVIGGDLGQWLLGDSEKKTMVPDELRAILGGAIPRPPTEPRKPWGVVSENEDGE